jgi:hypothetical protein
LLAAAVDAIAAGLGLPALLGTEPAASTTLEQRMRAANMALALLGARPSRNPMAPVAAEVPPPSDEPEWSKGTTAAEVPSSNLGQPGAAEAGEPFDEVEPAF